MAFLPGIGALYSLAKKHLLPIIEKDPSFANTLPGSVVKSILGGRLNVDEKEEFVNYMRPLYYYDQVPVLEGEGFFDDVSEYYKRFKKALSGPREIAPPEVRDFIQYLGDFQIVGINVCRKPIWKNIELAANLVTLGSFNKRKNELGYDKMFHLYLLVKLQKGSEIKQILIEKNEVANIQYVDRSIDSDCKVVPVNVSKGLNLKQFIENGEKYQGNSFWVYNVADNNCQVFVTTLLIANNLGDKSIYDFIKQNVQDLVVGPLSKISNFITNTAAKFHILRYGYGI